MTTPTVGNNVQPWLETLHQMATMNKQIDGHLTIMAFTTGWKAMFGTPELSEAGRAELWQQATWPTLEKALEIVYQDAMSEIEYWNEDAALHGETTAQPATGDTFEQWVKKHVPEVNMQRLSFTSASLATTVTEPLRGVTDTEQLQDWLLRILLAFLLDGELGTGYEMTHHGIRDVLDALSSK